MASHFTKSTLHSMTRTALNTTKTRAFPCQTQLTRQFTNTPITKSPAKMSTSSLISLAQNRRTIYTLGKTAPIQDAESKIEELVNQAILHVPSSFNTQSTRLVVLLHGEHDKLWDIAIEAFGGLVESGKVSKEMWENQTLPKLKGFQAAYGTVLFFEDPAHIKPFQEKFPAFKDHFAPWADHSNAMHQYFLWTGLEALGFGANLQHYNPLIDAGVAKQWNLPTEWRLVAQMVFGSPEAGPGEKVQKPIEERVKIFGKL
ncbi:hypothetical protein N7508_001708 [Penicillium antarcticum]|nr:uncharacterized protein N7508_001708 [Penicillium antarcticum]KAJ5317200.1 hypothetical protein N7508_001708 [Penicillium antarcticum]